MLTRRDLLRAASAAGAALALRPGLAAHVGGVTRRVAASLVVVELTGGDDGLDTVPPYGDDRYRRARPALGRAASRVRPLDEVLGLASELEGLAALFHEGRLRVQLGVGMPAPDRSHFTSLDRWHAGDPAPSRRADGWLGRALDALTPDDAPFAATAFGDRALPRALAGARRPVATCETLADLRPGPAWRAAAADPARAALAESWGAPADRARDRAARDLADRLEGALSKPLRGGDLPGGDLGRKLSDVLRLTAGGIRIPATFVRTGGFDTHARQDRVRPQLLADLDAALTGFARALVARGDFERTLTIVYSEFGRRIAENGARGTDHGAAGPTLLLGGGVRPGLFGVRPDLRGVDGDVPATCDFRRPLASALAHLGHPDPAAALGPEGVPLGDD
ncbi:MAG TPA: DUF1501 domain-containing protein [Planctomycetota bacterium]|nr:DUF1501 domain-containing protein [Planctomycetota bacterium]